MIQDFKFEETGLSGAYLIRPFCARDERGSFVKDYSAEVFRMNGICHDLKEVFYTQSHKGVVRAIHFQRVKQQAKLVRCIWGRVYDVIVDLRPESETFGRWLGFWLSRENQRQLFVPEQFGHGYLVVEPAIVSYKCGEKFYGEYDDGIAWDDPDIGIKWPLEQVEGEVLLSKKDQSLQSFASFCKSLVDNKR